MGTKITVVGGGSTYTPGAGRGLRPPRRPARRSTSSSCSTSMPSGSRSSAASPSGCSTGCDWTGRLTLTGDRDAALDGADFVLVQLRVGGQAARLVDETLPLRFGRHRAGDDRGRRLRQGAADRARRPRPRRAARPTGRARTPGSSTSRTRSASSPRRSSTTAIGRIGLCNVAITLQRRFAAALRRGPGAGRARARRAEPPDLGAGGPGRRRRPPARAARRPDATSSPSELRLPADMLRTGSARSRPTTCATTT